MWRSLLKETLRHDGTGRCFSSRASPGLFSIAGLHEPKDFLRMMRDTRARHVCTCLSMHAAPCRAHDAPFEPRLTIACCLVGRCDELLQKVALAPPDAGVVRMMDDLSDEVGRVEQEQHQRRSGSMQMTCIQAEAQAHQRNARQQAAPGPASPLRMHPLHHQSYTHP
jgi:hypothetical protein